MSGSEWRPTRLTADQLEERRLAAATLLRQGQMTQAAIARHLGVSRASVCRWAVVLQEQGRRRLRARPRTGRPPRLDARAWSRLDRLLAKGAAAAGFETERWTLEGIAAVVRRGVGGRQPPPHPPPPPEGD